jgi:hypothetical protein
MYFCYTFMNRNSLKARRDAASSVFADIISTRPSAFLSLSVTQKTKPDGCISIGLNTVWIYLILGVLAPDARGVYGPRGY